MKQADWTGVLAELLAGPPMHDEGVEAARNACVAGASIASAVITAAAWYDNPLTGVRALRACLDRLASLTAPFAVARWRSTFARAPHPETGDPDLSPGFGFVTPAQARRVTAAGSRLVAPAGERAWPRTGFFLRHRRQIAAASGPLNATGLCALAFADRAVDGDEAERRFLMWRIEPAVVEAQRARARGLAAFPFFTEQYVYEGPMPKPRPLDLGSLLARVGLT